MQSKKAYELVTTGKPDDPAFPHAMVLTVSFVIFPVIGLCCHRRFASAQNLTPASRRQNHTTSPSASVLFVSSTVSVHHIPPRVRDDRERPSVGRDGAIRKVFRLREEARYFCGQGWTGVLRKCRPARHCERSEAIQLANHKAGLLRRFASRNDEIKCATSSRGT